MQPQCRDIELASAGGMLTDHETAELCTKVDANSDRDDATDKPVALCRYAGGGQLHRTSYNDGDNR